MKICIKCRISKDEILDFYWQEKKKGRRHSICKECCNIRSKKYREQNRDKLISYMNKWKMANSELVKSNNKKHNKLTLLKNRQNLFNFIKDKCCIDCGNKDHRTFQFHHRDPKIKKDNINRMMSSTWKTLFSEIEKCDILCANCHQIKTFTELNSYRITFK